LLGGGDLVGLLVNIDVRQDQAGLSVECVQQLRCLAVPEIVETVPERLAIERDGARRSAGHGVQKNCRMAAENLLDGLWIEAQQDAANGGMAGCALPAQTEGGVQPVAMHLDESFDRPIRVAAGDRGKHREQQDIRQLIEFSLGPARVRYLAEQANQLVERSHGNLLAVWLPCIDSKISPRRNPPIAPPTRFTPGVALRTHCLRS